MSGRVHERIPYAVQVEFRTTSSFLVAYSVNLSRGGMFLETEQTAEIGTLVTVHLAVPGAGALSLLCRVAWRRLASEADKGPPGLGVELQDPDGALGKLIDHLITSYNGLNVLLMTRKLHDRSSLTRLVRSVVSTAAVSTPPTIETAEEMISASLDLIIVEIDDDDAVRIIRRAKTDTPPVPVIALASTKKTRERAMAAGADEVVGNPPPFGELQAALLRTLSRPLRVR